MILFDLCCKNNHLFEAWFPSSKKYEDQKKRKLIRCPICNTSSVDKALMAPNISTNKKKETASHFKTLQENSENNVLQKKLKKLKRIVEQNTEDVGTQFAEEARKMYYGEKEKRSIRGQTTQDEAKELAEEGVPFSKLPWSSKEDA